jgi:sterol desaturase/sphingolipid hydroxylase (fatty acid hydroxylase superfamily)
MLGDSSTILLLMIIVLLVGLEFRDAQFFKSCFHDGRRMRRNLGFLAASLIVMPFITILDEWIRQHAASLVDWQSNWLAETVSCFLVAELLGWLLHYIKHQNQFLWNFHFQHHREDQYNIWLVTHTHAGEVLISAGLIAVITCLLGFSKPVVMAYLLFYSLAKVYQHSANDYTLGPLDRVIISPRYHRLHHHVDNRCNYGVALTVFDVLFGTVQWPLPSQEESQQFGVNPQCRLPFSYWEEMLYFLRSKNGS